MRVTPDGSRTAPSRASVADIARVAGVSTATVDRVLNRRPGVRDATAQKVLKAAAELDYLPEHDLQAALAAPPMRLVFLLPDGGNRFIRMLGDTVGYSQEHLTPFNVKCRTQLFESFNPHQLANELLRCGQRCDGIAFMALEHPAVREAVSTLADQGVPTLTLISDLSSSRRAGYVGLDNRAAGRTAGYLVGRFIGPGVRSGKVALIAGSLSYRAHEEREAGFLHVIEEMFPALQVVGLREGQDDAQKNYEQTRTLLDQHPDLAGIYNIGGASDGVARALKECGREHKVVFIGHGLTPDTRAMLIDGSMDAVITQSPQTAMMSCVRMFTNLRDKRDTMSGVDAVRSQVIFRENLP
jgi:LacI family transcriptional regulator